jgi:branched-chain amino acid transport system substrate-binding protein
MKAIALLLLLFVLTACAEEKIQETVTVAAILPMTGPAANIGERARTGLELATEEINVNGGINGKQIVLLVEDSQTNPAAGVTAFRNIESSQQPIFYICALSSVCTAMAPSADEHHVVLAGIMTNAPAFTENKTWAFRYFPLSQTEVDTALKLADDLGVEKLGILYLNDERGVSVNKLASVQFKGEVRSETFGAKDVDFKTQITKLKDTDAIYTVGLDTHLLPLFKQLKETGYAGHIISSSSAAVPNVVASEQAQGVYIAAPMIYKQGQGEEFKQKYAARFNASANQEAAIAYDLMYLIAKQQPGSRADVRQALEQDFAFKGLMGEITTFQGGHERSFRFPPGRIINGTIIYLE